MDNLKEAPLRYRNVKILHNKMAGNIVRNENMTAFIDATENIEIPEGTHNPNDELLGNQNGPRMECVEEQEITREEMLETKGKHKTSRGLAFLRRKWSFAEKLTTYALFFEVFGYVSECCCSSTWDASGQFGDLSQFGLIARIGSVQIFLSLAGFVSWHPGSNIVGSGATYQNDHSSSLFDVHSADGWSSHVGCSSG